MTRKKILIPIAVALLGGLALFAGLRNCAIAQISAGEQWSYEWTAPATGSPVVKYAVEISINGAVVDTAYAVGTTTIDLDVVFGNDYSIRVAGIDAANRWGPWSAPSVLETAEEAPPTNASEAR